MIHWYNIGTNNTFFPVIQNITVNDSILLINSTFEAWINMSAYQIYTNNSIASFNTTNGFANNRTNSSSVFVPGLIGLNNILISVAGNYSVNSTCSVATALSTNQCSATIYDTLLTLKANNGSVLLSDWSYALNNTALGGAFINGSSGSNTSMQLPLLQGYPLTVNMTKGGYQENTTTLTLSNNNVTYNATLQPITLFFNFREEQNRTLLNGTTIQFTIIDGQGNQTPGTTTTGQSNLLGSLLVGSYTMRYAASGYSSRDYYFTVTYANQNLTFYLISSSIYTPGVVEVRDYDISVVSGAIVKLKRYYGNISIPNVVEMATTGYDGSAVMTAEAITAFYTREVIVNGITRFNTTTPELLAIQSDGLWHRTFVLGSNVTQAQTQQSGIQPIFSPRTSITNGSSVNFTFNVTSTYWNISSCTITITNLSNGVSLGSNTSFCTPSLGPSLLITVAQNGSVNVTGTISTAYFTNTYSTTYTIINGNDAEFTVSDLVQDMRNFSKSGFDDTSRIILAVLAIMLIVWGATSKFETLSNPENVILLVFSLTLLFSYVGFLRIDTIPFPFEILKQYMIAILVGIFTTVSMIRKWGAT
jgi:hypothetical protein